MTVMEKSLIRNLNFLNINKPYFPARSCEDSDPPEPFLGIDMDWPQKSKLSGTRVTYTCPFKKITDIEWLTGTLFSVITILINTLFIISENYLNQM